MPDRVRLSRAKGWRMPPNTVRVARPSRWENPFDHRLLGKELAVEMFADLMNGFFDPFKLKHLTDVEFRALYDAKTEWEKRIGVERACAARYELRGKSLACWCKIGAPCHADVLLRIAAEPAQPQEGSRRDE